MRKISSKGIDIIKNFEGFSSVPYKCLGGYETIGWGHKIDKNENFSRISKNMAEKLLENDIKKFEYSVSKYIRNDINDNQFSALVSFTYNLGAGALQRSTLRQKINYESSEDEIRSEFMKWVRAGGFIISGLINRRKIESDLFFL
jgi:lysozyme